MTRFLTIFGITFAVLEGLFLAWIAVVHIAGNNTTSMPRGFYRLGHDPFRRDGLVTTKSLLKRMVGVPGDEICPNADGTYINHQRVPNSAPAATFPAQRQVNYCFVLPKGWYWLLGDSPDSWDSRYIGPVPLSDIASTAQPLWTEGKK